MQSPMQSLVTRPVHIIAQIPSWLVQASVRSVIVLQIVDDGCIHSGQTQELVAASADFVQ